MAREPKDSKKRKNCNFCADHVDYIDYKDTKRLQKCTSERGKILPRRVTATCAYHQRALTEAIKRAPSLPEDALLLVNLSGRGDKDMDTVARYKEQKR